MGNTPSNSAICESEDVWWTNGERLNVEAPIPEEQNTFENNTQWNFMEEFQRKRENRKIILEQKRKEIQNMREEIQILRTENQRLRNNSDSIQENPNNDRIEFLQRQNQMLLEDIAKMKEREQHRECLLEKNKELRISISQMQSELQTLNSSILVFEQEKKDYKRHVVALKDVIKVSKELLLIRENELMELKKKMQIIENEFNEKEASLMSNDLRKEYERQLANIRTLRELYEERSRTHRRETDLLKSSIMEKDKEIEESVRKMSELQERVAQLEKDDSDKYDTIKSLESNLGLTKAECRQFQAELTVINQLFSHILMAFNNSPDLDLDKLLKQLEAHHDLLKDIVSNEVSSEVSSALPKVLLDLVNRMSVEAHDRLTDNDPQDEMESTAAESNEFSAVTLHNLNSPAEIAENLPKVWKVLIELLSHQSANIPAPENCEEEDENRCFKTVVTPKGPSLVLSVSKTFFRLKELIVEKKSLEKDMNNLKQLNSHLETRLQDQEKRFDVVSSELSKTWSFVSKLQKEHHLLHTQEKILRYELAQKRKLLKELREELEYSREKWQQAREKNSKTEKEWLVLRKEFAARKKTIINLDENNSVESGYSDEKEESSDEEPGYETDISECNQKVDATYGDEAEAEVLLNDNLDLSSQNEDRCETDSLLSPNEVSINREEVQILSDENISNSITNVIQTEIIEITSNNPLSDNEFSSNTVVIVEESEVEQETNALDNSDSDNPESSLGSVEFSQTPQTLEERLAARDERLSKLEGQCRALVSQVTNTSHRSAAICNKLEDLHEIYGESSRNSVNDQNVDANQPHKAREEMETEDEEDHPESG